MAARRLPRRTEALGRTIWALGVRVSLLRRTEIVSKKVEGKRSIECEGGWRKKKRHNYALAKSSASGPDFLLSRPSIMGSFQVSPQCSQGSLQLPASNFANQAPNLQMQQLGRVHMPRYSASPTSLVKGHSHSRKSERAGEIQRLPLQPSLWRDIGEDAV